MHQIKDDFEAILQKYIIMSIAVFVICTAFFGLLGYGSLALFPQTRYIITTLGSGLAGKEINLDIWNQRLLYLAWFGWFVSLFLFVFLFRYIISRISVDKKAMIYTITQVLMIVFYSFILILLAASTKAVWTDEVWSIDLVLGHIDITRDSHPPLYYLMLKLFVSLFGSGLFAIKMLSVFPSILMLIFMTLFLKKEFSNKTAFFFLLPCLASESITHFSIEIRMYSWALFFVTMMAASTWLFIKYNKKRWSVLMLFSALGAAYTNYYALFVVCIIYLTLLFYVLKYQKQKIRIMVYISISAIVLYFPCILLLVRQFMVNSNNSWIPPVTIADITNSIMMVFSTGNILLDRLYVLFFCILLLFSLLKKNKNEKDFFSLCGLFCFIFFVSSLVLFSFFVQPVLYNHYLFPGYGLVWLFFAIACNNFKNKRIINSLFVLFVSLCLMSFSHSVAKERNENHNFHTFYNFISEKIHPDDTFLISHATDEMWKYWHLSSILRYYFQGHAIARSDYKEYTSHAIDENTTWTFVTNDIWKEGANNIKGKFCGIFGWNGSYPHFGGCPEFRLYYNPYSHFEYTTEQNE